MKKFTDKINESKEDINQLEMGIKIESEHGDIYDYLDIYLESFNVPMPWSKEEFYKKIAEAHLREIPDYYTKLNEIEE
jgi:hypothetical protein